MLKLFIRACLVDRPKPFAPGNSHLARQQQAFRPVPQENLSFVEQAGKPVHKRLIENGAISQW
jgi:hypothetical protein